MKSLKELCRLRYYYYISHLHELIEVKTSVVQARKKNAMTDAAAAAAAAEEAAAGNKR